MSAIEYSSPATNGRSARRLVQDPVEPVGLVDVAVDGVGDPLGRVLDEMMVLAGHRAEATHLPEQPLQHLDPAAQVGRDEPAGLLGEIEQDGAGLEDGDRAAAAGGIVVDDRRHPVVGCDRQEPGPELLSATDVDGKIR